VVTNLKFLVGAGFYIQALPKGLHWVGGAPSAFLTNGVRTMANWKRILFIMAITALCASSQEKHRPMCPDLFGKSITVTGRIVRAYVDDDKAIYELDSKDSPCLSLYFNVVDAKGKVRCKADQQITASGIVKNNGLGADLLSTDYSCK
jgi:hypothetical protein